VVTELVPLKGLGDEVRTSTVCAICAYKFGFQFPDADKSILRSIEIILLHIVML